MYVEGRVLCVVENNNNWKTMYNKTTTVTLEHARRGLITSANTAHVLFVYELSILTLPQQNAIKTWFFIVLL